MKTQPRRQPAQPMVCLVGGLSANKKGKAWRLMFSFHFSYKKTHGASHLSRGYPSILAFFSAQRSKVKNIEFKTPESSHRNSLIHSMQKAWVVF